MKKLRFLVGACVIAALGTFAATATAEDEPPPPCGVHSTPISGTVHGNLTITGNRAVGFGQTLTVYGNLRVAHGACFEAFAGSASIAGNVYVGQGGVFALGYGPGAYSVGGNVTANRPGSLYLGGTTIHGDVVSYGGGDPHRNFPIKDNSIGGNLIVKGWYGLWIGLIRNHVGGSVVFSGNTAADLTQLPGNDSSEVVSNVIAGDLTCFHNAPVVQIGDSEGSPNVVGGHAFGECATLID